MKRTLLSLVTVALVAVTATAQREKTEAAWDEGKVTIDYGSPKWRNDFAEQMKKTETWRLGNNDPTGLKLTCGLVTASGPIPAGDYKLAMHKTKAGAWDLLVYEGDGFYSKKMKSWAIRPASSSDKAEISDALAITLGDKKTLQVRFGPHNVVYPFQTVKMHKPVETDFARIKASVNVMAIPCASTITKLGCGSASISPGGSKVTWAMSLTVDGESCSLHFVNDRATLISGGKDAAKANIEQLKKRMENADENGKARFAARIKREEQSIKKLDADAAAMAGYKDKHTVTGKVSARSTPTSTLAFESERIKGGIILVFGCGEKTATFDVSPRSFRAPSR